MRGKYYHKEHYSNLLRDIRLFNCVDLLIKYSVSLIIFIVLLYIGSLWLAIAFLTGLAVLKLFGWLFITGLRYVLKKWYGAAIYSIFGNQKESVKIGNYRVKQIKEWIIQICTELQVLKPVELIIYDSKYANAFASQERWFGLMKRSRVALLSNLFSLLNEDELKAILAHEVGHHKHFPNVGILAQILVPYLMNRPSYRWLLEHLSDWYAANTVGVVPTVNALIKIYHRGHLISEINKGLEYVQRDFKIGLAGIAEFQEIANDVIPDKIRPDEDLEKYIVRVIDKYFERRSPKLRGIGKTHVKKYRDETITEPNVGRSKYKLIDWRTFDARIKDNYLDEDELEDLYLHMKNDEKVCFFLTYIPKHAGLEKWSSHPPLRERIIFIVEASVPAANSN